MNPSMIRGLLFTVVLSQGMSMIADETVQFGRCSDIDHQHECAHLGELSDSVLLVGILKSCSESTVSVPLGSNEDPGSSVIYQFNLTHVDIVKLSVDGLGETLVLKEDTIVFRADEGTSSVERRFLPGRYTLIGRAPFCRNGAEDWNGGYKIRIASQGLDGSSTNAWETVDTSGEVVVLTREERKPVLGRVGMWSLFVSTTVLGIAFITLLLFAVAA